MTEITDDTITPKAKRLITKDWRAEFPNLKQLRPMEIGRRIGPIYQYVLMERLGGGWEYRVWAAVDFLGGVEDQFLLSASYHACVPKRPGLELSITPQKHDSEYRYAAQDIRRHTYIPLDRPIGLLEILSGYEKWFQAAPDLFIPHMRDVVGLLSACGHDRIAQRQIDRVAALDPTVHHFITPPGKEPYIEELRGIAADPDALRARIEAKAELMKLERVPHLELTNLDLPSSYQKQQA